MARPRAEVGATDERVAAAWLKEAEEIGRRIAADLGAPADADKIGEKEALRLWALADPGVDYEALYEQLAGGGLPPEMVKSLAIVAEHPDLEPLYTDLAAHAEQSGVAVEELADQLARLAEYPFRLGLIEHLDDEAERAGLAEHYDRAWQKQMPAAPAQEEPEAMMPAPEPAPEPFQDAQPAPAMPPGPPDVMPMMTSQTPLPGMDGAMPMGGAS